MTNQLPRIPREEYRERYEKVQRAMAQEKLDMLLIYADDRHTYGAAYARYYADFPVAFEPVLLLFVPGEDPKLLVGPETIGYADEVGVIKKKDIRVLKEFAAEHEDYLFTELTPLRDLVAGHDIRRLGLGGFQLMGAQIYETIASAFPDAQRVIMDAVLEPLRGIKTDAELEVIRYAYKIANLGMEAAVRAIAPGVTEREVAAEAEYAMRKAGSEGTGIDTIVCSGPNTYHILGRTTMRKIEENDLVVVTVAPRYEGYHGACARSVIVGNPGERVIDAVKAEVRAQDVCGENLIAGKIGCEVEAMGRAVMSEAGYGENFLYSGLHSVGVIEFEPPILGPSSNTVIENNMVISVDIPLFEASIMGSRTEDGYVIANGKAERLTTMPRLICK